ARRIRIQLRCKSEDGFRWFVNSFRRVMVFSFFPGGFGYARLRNLSELRFPERGEGGCRGKESSLSRPGFKCPWCPIALDPAGPNTDLSRRSLVRGRKPLVEPRAEPRA